MRNIEKLKAQGFKFITEKRNIQVWAKFTGYEDCVQYVYVSNNNEITMEITNFSTLMLQHCLYEGLSKDFFKMDFSNSYQEIWSEFNQFKDK